MLHFLSCIIVYIKYFFRRQRATQPGNSPWEILLDSLNATINSLQVQVINTRSQARLQLQLIALADSTLHLQLDELNPMKLRYRAQESLSGSPQFARYILSSYSNFFFFFYFVKLLKIIFIFYSLKILDQSGDSVSLSFGGTGKAVLLVKPFRLDVYDGDQLVISVNARGLLNFEHQRLRKSK